MSRGASNINAKRLKEYLIKLKKFEKDDFTLEEGKKFVFNEFDYSFLFIRTYHEFYKYPFFRARVLHTNENPIDSRVFSYPPLRNNKLGRSNLKGKPVFYASDDPLTAIVESLNAGIFQEEVYLSEWNLKNKVSIPTFPIIKNPYTYDDYIKKEVFTNFNEDIFKAINEIFEITIRLFQKTSGYSYTAPFCHFLLYHLHICDMVIYPSIMTKYKSICYAINHEFVDRYFTLKKVYKIHVEEIIDIEDMESISNKVGLLRILKVGEVINGEIVYRDLEKAEKDFFDYYSMDLNSNNELAFKSDVRTF